MKRHSAHQDRLGLEMLETRMLLAADLSDPFGLVADLNTTMHAVSGTGGFDGTFVTNFGNHRLVLTGSATSSITIDLDQLPSYITSLKISSFDEVNIVGKDHVDSLIITDVNSVTANGLDVTDATFTTNVHSLTIDSLGTSAVLVGSAMSLNAHSLDDTTLFSDVGTLTVTSESRTIQYVAIPNVASAPVLNLTYVPDVLAVSGIPKSSIHVILSASIPETSGIPAAGTTVDVTGPGSPEAVITIDPPNYVPNEGTVIVTSPGSGNSGENNHLVVVSFPLDERTQTLLDQLRSFLRSSQSDAYQGILNLLSHSHVSVASNSGTIAIDNAKSGLNPVALNLWPHGDYLLGEIPTLAFQPSTEKTGMPLSVIPTIEWLPSNVNAPLITGEPTSASLSTGIPDSTAAEVDLTWVGANPQGSAEMRPATGLSTPPSTIDTVVDNVRAFGSYVVERVSAEFSPGQQSVVLLVDPKPTRPAGAARSVAEDTSNRAQRRVQLTPQLA